MTLTPNLSVQPPNPNVGFNYSWVSIGNPSRTLYAQAVYSVNSDGINPSSGSVFVDTSATQTGNFTMFKVVSACKFTGLTGTNVTVGNLSAYELPQQFEFKGQFTQFSLRYGAIIAYKE